MPDHSNILVTGAAGFIGSNLCEALLHRGAQVIGLDNFDPFHEEALKRANIGAIAKTAARLEGSFRLVEGDLCDVDLAHGLLNANGVSAILHLAAKAGVRPSLDDPLAYARANIEGTINLLECGRRATAKATPWRRYDAVSAHETQLRLRLAAQARLHLQQVVVLKVRRERAQVPHGPLTAAKMASRNC